MVFHGRTPEASAAPGKPGSSPRLGSPSPGPSGSALAELRGRRICKGARRIGGARSGGRAVQGRAGLEGRGVEGARWRARRIRGARLERAPPRRGPLGSRPISRILSWTVIHLPLIALTAIERGGPRGPAAYLGLGGQRHRPCLALHRVGFAWPARRRAAGALLPHHFTLAGDGSHVQTRRLGGVFLWHFPAGFPGSDSPTTPPCGVRTFLEGPVVSPASPRLLSQQGQC